MPNLLGTVRTSLARHFVESIRCKCERGSAVAQGLIATTTSWRPGLTPKNEYRPRLIPLDTTYETTAQLPVYHGQLEPIRAWPLGRVLDVACNFGRLCSLSPVTVSLDALVPQLFARKHNNGNGAPPGNEGNLAQHESAQV